MSIISNIKEKPRDSGINAITDTGIPLGELEKILEAYSCYIDIAKFGVGSAVVEPQLKQKVDLYKENNIKVYFGGTLFEKYYQAEKLDDYKQMLDQYNIDSIEISTGIIDISLEDRVDLVSSLSQDFTVFSEVGSKDTDHIMAPSKWLNEIDALLEAGSWKVITEGRDSATAGIFRTSGEVREGLLSDILDTFDKSKIIFEAPTSQSQMYFINAVGTDVNLGNIHPREILLLEAQRKGLRCETFFSS